MTTTRRSFIRNAAIITPGAALAPHLLAAQSGSKKRALKKAMMWDTIGYKGTVMEKCRAVKAAGFDGIEPSSHMNQDEVVKAMDETGLKAASVCCSTHWKQTLSHPEEAVREQGLEGVKQAIRDAKRYGATSVLVVPGVARNGVSYQECWDRSIAQVRKAIPLCEETGVKIAIENVWNDFLMKPQQAKDYLAAINSPWVGFHFDIGNMIKFGPSEEWVKVLGKNILKLHVKDYSIAKGFGVKLGEGDAHWPQIMAAIDEIGYTGWAITEQPGNQSKDAESLKEFSAAVDRVLSA
jgi:L-ribulose-5-phosphate 3-epimerase